jgi:NAD(P)-dependent dehydrogenase (short-subunit alcohol dehydrogenase family)
MRKTVLITGAARGLGLCFVRRYLETGARVFAGVRELSAPGMIQLQQEYGDSIIPVVLEVTDTSSVSQAVQVLEGYTDHLDILINNAAIHNDTSFELLEKADIDDCLRVYDVNSLGPLRVVKAMLPLLRKTTGAKVINISTESGSISTCGREKEFDYCMSKAALNMATKLLSNYLEKDGVTVLAVHPGWMRTDMGGRNADLDPYETACQLVEIFDGIKVSDNPIFIDNKGNAYPW